MRENEYRVFCQDHGLNDEDLQTALASVNQFEAFLKEKKKSLEEMTVTDVQEYVSELIVQGRNSWDRLRALARYSNMIGNNQVYIYFTSILGGRTILPSISSRLTKLGGEDTAQEIFRDIEEPPLGAPPEEFPKVVKTLVERLHSNLDPELYNSVLAGNHHKIPVESFEKHKLWLKEEESIDSYLKRAHEEAVKELEKYSNTGEVWYEQEITPEVVEYVRGNQEILSGVREDDWIYMTKIPYTPKDYLTETDPLMKRYYACHCPLVREAIMMKDTDIPMTWCYCSGGFVKLKLDVLFEEDTEVEVLESALTGDDRCRFRVKIPATKRD